MTASTGDLADLLRERVSQSLQAHGRLADELSSLADEPLRFSERRAQLDTLHSEELASARQLGLALIQYVVSGGRTLDLTPSGESASTGDAKEATAQEVDEFKAEFANNRTAIPERTSMPPPHVWLQQYAERLGVPRVIASDVDLIDQLEHLESLTEKEELTQWLRLPPREHVTLLCALVAWTRGLQDRIQGMVVDRARPDVLFRKLAEHRREAAPGFVYGLRRDDAPIGESWLDDAMAHLESLRKYAFEPHVPACVEAVRRPARHTQTGAAAEPPGAVVDPTLVDRTRGLRAVIFGGGRRPERVEALLEQFEFGTLDWVETEHHLAADRLAQRIRGGTIDVVIASRFRGHRDSHKIECACELAGVALASARGYGLREVADALGRVLPGLAQGS